MRANGDGLYNGIDVSKWQRNIDFTSVREAGIEVVYIRSGFGNNAVDPFFAQNYQGAKAAGLSVGFYHHVTAASVSKARSQASFFVSTIGDKDFDCRLAVDFEEFGGLSNAEVNEIALAFAQETQSLTGKGVVIYSNAFNAGNVFSGKITSYPLWVAHYEVQQPSTGNWSDWVGWQLSNQSLINGINANVDTDFFKSGIFISPSNNTTGTTMYYTIQRGDTLSAIALRYGTTVNQIASLNGITNPNLIFAGTTIKIPDGKTTSSNTTINYTIQKGDTLSEIALRYGTTVNVLAGLNGISNPNRIYAGNVILIPVN